MKCWWKTTAAALALACAAGCRTTEDVLRDYEAALVAGNYGAPVDETIELASKKDGSQLLWQLMAGGALYMADDKARAQAIFDAAEDAMIANDKTSVFARAGDGALAMMTNDKAFDYDGGGQDRVFTCLYKAIDYITAGNVNAARTEFNRAAQHQENWIWERRKDVAAAAERMRRDASSYASQNNAQMQGSDSQVAGVLANASFSAQLQQNCNFNPATSGNLDALAPRDYMNTYVEHVAGVFRWLRGDGGSDYLKDVAALCPANSVAANDFAGAAGGRRPVEQVWIWAEDGLCPTREEWRLDLPLFFMPFVGNYAPYVGMALPVLRMRGAGATSWRVAASSGAVVQMEELADVDRLLKTEYDVYMRGAIAREITRTMVKAGVQVALGVAADAAERRAMKKGNSADYWALRMSQMAVAAWAMATTGADLRSWTALPKTVKVARVTRPADGRIDVWADGQKIELTLEPGNTLVFIRKPSPQATPAVKQVTFKR